MLLFSFLLLYKGVSKWNFRCSFFDEGFQVVEVRDRDLPRKLMEFLVFYFRFSYLS